MGVYTGTVPSFLAGEILDADKLTEVANFMTAATAAWTSYTPTWTASVNPAIGNGTRAGHYLQLGKFIHFRVRFVMGSTSTYGTGQWSVGLPVAAHANAVTTPLACRVFDFGTANRAGLAFITTALNAVAMVVGAADVASAVPQTWAVNDEFQISGVYEAA